MAAMLTDKRVIEAFLRRDTPLHIYALGDLDDFFWPSTTWYAAGESTAPTAIALLYTAATLPTLLALGRAELPALEGLLDSILPALPRRMYCHASPGLHPILARRFQLAPQGLHHKMLLTDWRKVDAYDTSAISELGARHADEVARFYAASYPGNWFEPRMLATDQYVGLRRDGELVSVAGVHVYSPAYRVATLGNIATHPAQRGKGYATIVTAAVCKRLRTSVDLIGLNVKADNAAAHRCYESVGFTFVAPYEEYLCTA